jgi:hypothetical protein
MTIKTGLAALTLLFLATPAPLEGRVPPEAPLLAKRLDMPVPPGDPDSSVVREVMIEVNINAARGAQERLRLPLFDATEELQLVQTSRRRNRHGDVIWSGRVRGQPASTVLFSTSREVLAATIATEPVEGRDARQFEIRFLGEGRHVLREVDPSTLPSERNPVIPELVQREPQATCSADPANSIDVLVLFTPRASARANGPEAMRQSIELYVEEANLSYEQSGITQRLRLVRASEMDYAESDDLDTDLQSLKKPGGQMAGVHEIRDTVGADLVALIVDYSKRKTDEIGCGQAFMMETVSNAFERSAFAVVPRICADRELSFTHELGHLMGARHDWADDAQASSPQEPFAFGHGFVHIPSSRATRPAFRTIMAKDALCEVQEPSVRCDRMAFWSNPDKSFPSTGVPLGVDGGEEPANNARALNSTAPTVANFRCRKEP